MKKKIFLVGAFTTLAMSGYFFFQANSQNSISHLALDNIEALSQGESGDKDCSATAYCYLNSTKVGEVSCKGKQKCTSGYQNVVCDGTKHECTLS